MIINPFSTGQLAGLTLKAWAQFAANGTLIKSYNVTSITKGGAGVYQLNFTNALATTTYLFRSHTYGKDGSQAAPTAPTSIMTQPGNTTGAGGFTQYHNGGAVDLPGYVEVYE